MKFIIDNKRKFIIGWSAKCGCTHIKYIYKYLHPEFDHNGFIHCDDMSNNLPNNWKDYKLIIIIRNPYERLVSGFLDKYSVCDQIYIQWILNSNKEITFNNFIKYLVKKKFNIVNKHHFTPQLSEYWNDDIINNKNVIFFDIKSIDYSIIENVYQKKIPNKIKNFKGEHINTKSIKFFHRNEKIYKKKLNDYCNIKPITKCMFSNKIKKKIDKFYQKDFLIFKKLGFDYYL